MRVTINVDDELVKRAQQLSGVTGRTALVHEALLALVERESAPELEPVPRRRSPRSNRTA